MGKPEGAVIDILITELLIEKSQARGSTSDMTPEMRKEFVEKLRRLIDAVDDKTLYLLVSGISPLLIMSNLEGVILTIP